MTDPAKMLVRRIGGVVLVILGAIVLFGPIVSTYGTGAAVGPKVLSDLAYTVTLGLMLTIMGLYFLTRRAKKAPEDHERR